MSEIVERCDYQTGDCITEKYAIERTLGEGSFGKVFLVQNRRNSQRCALKLFKFWEMNPKERKSLFARFQMEYETGRVESKYLVRSLENGTVNGNPYIVMEFCQNGDLQHYVNEHQNADLVKIGKEILCGLRDLHSCGKVHRDLKPENVLIHDNGTAVLTDFGLSGDRTKRLTAVNFMNKPIEIAGTPAYMAPEQAEPKNREVTVLPTMDIFAFGVMMYYLITKNYPFGPLETQDDLVFYFKNAREGNWDKNLLAKYPNGKKLNQVISGCLESDFKKRLQTTDSVLSLMPQGYNLTPSKDSFQKEILHGVLLRIMQGEDYGAVYKLNELLRGRCRIITMGFNEIAINNIIPITENLSSFISRKHCTLELGMNNQWFIRDGQWDTNSPNGWKPSTNGTYVNSKEVSSTGKPIQPGDIITIGDVKLRVEGY